MSYIGENGSLYFCSGECEAMSEKGFGSEETACIGQLIASGYGSVCIGADAFRSSSLLYMLAGSLSEYGAEVYICENTDISSFRFSLPMLGADIGIFIRSPFRLSLFDENGLPLCDEELYALKDAVYENKSEKNGKIHHFTSFGSIYAANIRKSADIREKLPCGISCGERGIRSLWEEFFTNDGEELSLQVSDDGMRVNLYSRSCGFIPYEKLVLAYISIFAQSGQAVYLPESFHYAAEKLPNVSIIRYKNGKKPPKEAVSQRFTDDSLYMCTKLLSDRVRFSAAVASLPDMMSIRRDVTVDGNIPISIYRSFSSPDGRIIVTQSGRSRLRLLAQAANMEAASELCAEWFDKIRRFGTESLQ